MSYERKVMHCTVITNICHRMIDVNIDVSKITHTVGYVGERIKLGFV